MSRATSSDWKPEVLRTLRALGGQGTLGDLVVITGLSRSEVQAALDDLLATDEAHVRVCRSGDVVYHLGDGGAPGERTATRKPSATARAYRVGFDRKTLRLIRAREGVLSLAELVEHTGLPLKEAKREMNRLAESYGGVWHPSLDGHVVCAFPELMVSAHGRFGTREPRPAWVRFEDPVWRAKTTGWRENARLSVSGAGLLGSLVAPWLVRDAGVGLVVLVVAAAALGLVVFGGGLLRGLEHFRAFRFHHSRSLRRYALGLVIETALAGKGVVSLDRAVKYLQARAGKRRVSRFAVEMALRDLAAEFDAPITEVNGDLFFGFRNVKRQFLASHLVRKRMRLQRTASGDTVFDTADPPLVAAERELEAFDERLAEPRSLPPPPPTAPLPPL